MFDPERANQEMMAALQPFMMEVMKRGEEFMANNPEPSPEDILSIADTLREPLLEIGVTEEELMMLNSFLRKNLENIKSPQDFVQGLSHAL